MMMIRWQYSNKCYMGTIFEPYWIEKVLLYIINVFIFFLLINLIKFTGWVSLYAIFMLLYCPILKMYHPFFFQPTARGVPNINVCGHWTFPYSLCIHSLTLAEEQWEKELEAELQDFEVVADGTKPNTDWEKDMDDLLGDGDDLK